MENQHIFLIRLCKTVVNISKRNTHKNTQYILTHCMAYFLQLLTNSNFQTTQYIIHHHYTFNNCSHFVGGFFGETVDNSRTIKVKLVPLLRHLGAQVKGCVRLQTHREEKVRSEKEISFMYFSM